MEKAKQSIRFEAEVGSDGTVSFSRYVDELQLKPGANVTVAIFSGTVSKRLKRLRVTEEEIETIAMKQFEDREHVVSFLSSQGMLKGKTFRPHAGKR